MSGLRSAVQPAEMAQRAVPFPYPGIYTGGITYWSFTYRMDADGRGRSCLRHSSGRMAYGDVVYDGKQLYTQDGVYDVVTARQDTLELHAAGSPLEVTLHRVEQAPTVCSEFFAR